MLLLADQNEFGLFVWGSFRQMQPNGEAHSNTWPADAFANMPGSKNGLDADLYRHVLQHDVATFLDVFGRRP